MLLVELWRTSLPPGVSSVFLCNSVFLCFSGASLCLLLLLRRLLLLVLWGASLIQRVTNTSSRRN